MGGYTDMVSSSELISTAGNVEHSNIIEYFEKRREEVDAFVARHFTWPGTLRLHSAALGLDILRAPLNVALSPILLLTRAAGFLSRRLGWHRGAQWLGRRRILLRTDVARRIETWIVSDLLNLPLPQGASARDPDALARAVLGAPQFREMIRKRASVAEADALGRRIAGALAEYGGTRSAVAEMTTALCTLVIGILAFQTLTPGMISMAPGIADAMAHGSAIAEFPLGQTLGGMWYGVFPANASPWLVTTTVAGLVMIGSVIAAFAGALADPVQSLLGIHRRRLLRLIDTLEAELIAAEERPFAAREHYYARFLDLWDATASVFRLFRN
jgi:hypothetical protein